MTARQEQLLRQMLDDADPVPVFELFGLARQVMEARGLQPKYPTLNLYCTWCLHPTLERNARGFRVLEQLAMEFVGAMQSASTQPDGHLDAFARRIDELLGFAELRAEFIALLTTLGLPTERFTSRSVWEDLVRRLFDYLLEKPIQYPENVQSREEKDPVRKSYDRMLATIAAHPDAPPVLAVGFEVDPKSEPGQRPDWGWVNWSIIIGAKGGTAQVVSRFALHEPPTAFASP